MKIVKVDNFGRDTVDDILICENVTGFYGEMMVNALNNALSGEHSDSYFRLVSDDYKIHKYEW